MPYIAVNLGYKLVRKNHEYDLAELQIQQLMENLQSARKNKSYLCKLSSLLVCIFFYIQNTFPTFGQVQWKFDQLAIEKINGMINQLGDNFESVMISYFEEFKKSMKARYRIPKSLVVAHAKDICFLVDTDNTYA